MDNSKYRLNGILTELLLSNLQRKHGSFERAVLQRSQHVNASVRELRMRARHVPPPLRLPPIPFLLSPPENNSSKPRNINMSFERD